MPLSINFSFFSRILILYFLRSELYLLTMQSGGCRLSRQENKLWSYFLFFFNAFKIMRQMWEFMYGSWCVHIYYTWVCQYICLESVHFSVCINIKNTYVIYMFTWRENCSCAYKAVYYNANALILFFNSCQEHEEYIIQILLLNIEDNCLVWGMEQKKKIMKWNDSIKTIFLVCCPVLVLFAFWYWWLQITKMVIIFKI